MVITLALLSLVRPMVPLISGSWWVCLRGKTLVVRLDSDLAPQKGCLTEFSMVFVKVGQLGLHSASLMVDGLLLWEFSLVFVKVEQMDGR